MMFNSIVLIYRPIQYRSDYESLHNKDTFNLRIFYFTEAYIFSKTYKIYWVSINYSLGQRTVYFPCH